MATKPYDELLKEEKIYHNVNDQAFHFFVKEVIHILGKKRIVLI